MELLISFSVRDIMFVGDKNFVIKIRNRLIQSLIKFFKISKINCKIEIANDPFFISNIDKKVFQDAMDLKYEIVANIPFIKNEVHVKCSSYLR